MRTPILGILASLVTLLALATSTSAQEYVGSAACISCHQNTTPDIVNEYIKSGHPYKLNAVDGAPPTYPENTSPGVPNTPPGTEWSDFAYVIGGYGWKARFVKPDGRVYTTGDSVQYNLADGSWVAYHKGEDKKYDYSCFQCHTTAPTAEGSWNGVPEDSMGVFGEPGVRCEGCHGPGSDHVANPSGVKPPIQDVDLSKNRCVECHQRGSATNAIPASGGYVRHHEQGNTMAASKHGDGVGAELTCVSCHNPHVALRYPEAAGDGFDGLNATCETCHFDKEIKLNDGTKDISCQSCHMPLASKSALGTQVGNGWKGDLPTHLWGINTEAVTREAMFTDDGGLVALDEDGLGKVTLDFACLACHTDKTVDWASGYAAKIHENGIVTLSLYSVDGRLVGRLVDQPMPTGFHTVRIDGSTLPSGVYLYELIAGEARFTKSMTLSK
jgi:hypothetical protein